MTPQNIDNILRYYSKVFFSIASFILGFRSCFGMTAIGSNIIFKIMTAVLWILVLISIILNKYTIKNLLFITLLLIVGGLIKINANTSLFIFNFLMIAAAKNKDSVQSIKYFVTGLTFAFVSIFLLSLSNIIPSKYLKGEGWDIGLGNPNSASLVVILIVLFYTYVYYPRLSISHIFLFTVFGTFFYKLTGSRTGLAVTYFITSYTFFSRTRNKFKNYCLKQSLYTCLFFCLFCLLGITFCTIHPFWERANQILSGRFFQAQYYILKYGIHPFGSYIIELSPNYREKRFALLDCGYGRLLINHGFIIFIIFLGFYWKKISMSIKQKDFRANILLSSALLAMITESCWINVIYNYSIILCSDVIFRKKQEYIIKKAYCSRKSCELLRDKIKVPPILNLSEEIK